MENFAEKLEHSSVTLHNRRLPSCAADYADGSNGRVRTDAVW